MRRRGTAIKAPWLHPARQIKIDNWTARHLWSRVALCSLSRANTAPRGGQASSHGPARPFHAASCCARRRRSHPRQSATFARADCRATAVPCGSVEKSRLAHTTSPRSRPNPASRRRLRMVLHQCNLAAYLSGTLCDRRHFPGSLLPSSTTAPLSPGAAPIVLSRHRCRAGPAPWSLSGCGSTPRSIVSLDGRRARARGCIDVIRCDATPMGMRLAADEPPSPLSPPSPSPSIDSYRLSPPCIYS